MFGIKKIHPKVDAPKVLDGIENTVYASVKPLGFRKHGRTLHRFVSGDISQVINFQLGQSYRDETHLLWVNIGIRVPECMERSFVPKDAPKKYYHEYDCNIRSELGTVEGKKQTTYNLHKPIEPITADVMRQIHTIVLPGFDVLNSREAILAHRRSYPHFDTMNDHLILLEESMMYGRMGQREKAEELFRRYVREVEAQKGSRAVPGHLSYLKELADEIGIEISSNRGEEYHV